MGHTTSSLLKQFDPNIPSHIRIVEQGRRHRFSSLTTNVGLRVLKYAAVYGNNCNSNTPPGVLVAELDFTSGHSRATKAQWRSDK